MKKILIIAYHFPPDSQVGGIRPAKFAKYLPEFGWEPHILTIKDKYIEETDSSRLKEIESVRITRTSVFPRLMDLLLYIKRLFITPKPDQSLHFSQSDSDSPEAEQERDSLLKRSLNSLLESPDKQFGWFIPAVWAGLKIIRKEKIDVILATSPPATVNFIGLALAFLTGKKLVTDLRDPLVLHTAKALSHQTQLSNYIEKHLEDSLYNKTALVISATEKHSLYFRERFKGKYPDKFHPIWNGFDSSDFDNTETKDKTKNKKFTLNYLGSFYGSRSPSHFLQAIKELIVKNIITKNDIEINFIGNVEQTSEGETIDMIKKHQLESCVHLHGQVPYKEALKNMRQADVLLLIAPADMNRYAIPAKAFEYMYANNNILCLATDSPTGELVEKVGCGKVADVFSVEQIAQCIQQFYTEWKNNELQTENSKIAMFERKYQTKELAKLLDTLVSVENKQ